PVSPSRLSAASARSPGERLWSGAGDPDGSALNATGAELPPGVSGAPASWYSGASVAADSGLLSWRARSTADDSTNPTTAITPNRATFGRSAPSRLMRSAQRGRLEAEHVVRAEVLVRVAVFVGQRDVRGHAAPGGQAREIDRARVVPELAGG